MPDDPRFDDRFSIIHFDRCAVSLKARQQVSITEADALMILERCFELTGHRKYVVLAHMDMIVEISAEARKVLASARNVAVAAMLGSSLMDQILSAAYERAPYPSQYFTDQTEALTWLASMHDLVCEDPVEHTMSLTVDLDPFRSRPHNTT